MAFILALSFAAGVVATASPHTAAAVAAAPVCPPPLPPAPVPFTPRSIVALRVGDGVLPLASGFTAPTFLDEFSADTGALLQTISVTEGAPGPSNCSVVSGSTVGGMTLSSSGNVLAIPCYNLPVGVAPDLQR